MLLQASLGLSINASEQRVVLNRPALPDSVTSLRIDSLQLGDSQVDLEVERVGHEVKVNVEHADQRLDVVVQK